MDDNLSKEFQEIMKEIKKLFIESYLADSLSDMDSKSVMEQINTMRLMNRTMDLCCAMFEKQYELMAKMDKALDKYLDE